ncbi:MAG: hypothetical protein MUF33_01915 [Candidatus Nanopelagicales bacterium]|jgi:hypothetical protein|nr:hypothetical protein [Candidatus Nanopelagicales bacterium]MCU0297257.1 hypothetical protein [Candidatus Nanopelagicales bacterium]
MLQSISGLSDEQVPTGEGTNVTAIRSRIFHSSEPRAYISFHSRTSFLEEVVRPYFIDLAISPLPTSLDAFEVTARPHGAGFSELESMYEQSKAQGLSKEAKAKWDRLIDIGRALPHLRLDGSELQLTDLSDLRRFVAYPTTADKDREDLPGGQAAPRDYLGVRDCRVESPFPVTALDRLGLVDLPGLGESAAGIDQRIVTGLSGEVDVVLMVFRAVTGLANIDTIDRAALDLITLAQGAISDSRDFAWIVVNASPDQDSARRDLISELHRDFNERSPDSKYSVLTADAKDARSMHFDVLLPVLNRLADRLPYMDEEVLQGAVAAMEPALRSVRAASTALEDAIREAKTQSGTPRQVLFELAGELRKDIQESLATLKPRKLGSTYVAQYLDEIESIHSGVRDWLFVGLGRAESRDDWQTLADREWGVARSHGPFANSELHRLRVEITRRYAQLDYFLNDVLVEEFYGLVCAALSGEAEGTVNRAEAQRGYLLGDSTSKPSQKLHALTRRLGACDPAVPSLTAAVEQLTGIHFDFRIQSYPLLYDLNLEMRPRENADPPFPPAFEHLQTPFMYDWFLESFTRYSFRIKRELRQDAERQIRVLSGAALVFEDEIVRSGESGAEFWNLAESYRDELWPGRFEGLNQSSARAQQFSKTVRRLSAAINEALEVSP